MKKFIISLSLITLIFSCSKTENSIERDARLGNNQNEAIANLNGNGAFETNNSNNFGFMSPSGENDSLVRQLSQLVIQSLNSISLLPQSGYNDLYNILEDNSLSGSQKMANIALNPNLAIVFQNLTAYQDFLNQNSALINSPNFHNTLASQLLSDFEVDVAIINQDPCAIYKSTIAGCATNFAVCAITGSAAGPPMGAVFIAMCGAVLWNCVDTADLSFPNCVQGGIFKDITDRFRGLENTRNSLPPNE